LRRPRTPSPARPRRTRSSAACRRRACAAPPPVPAQCEWVRHSTPRHDPLRDEGVHLGVRRHSRAVDLGCSYVHVVVDERGCPPNLQRRVNEAVKRRVLRLSPEAIIAMVNGKALCKLSANRSSPVTARTCSASCPRAAVATSPWTKAPRPARITHPSRRRRLPEPSDQPKPAQPAPLRRNSRAEAAALPRQPRAPRADCCSRTMCTITPRVRSASCSASEKRWAAPVLLGSHVLGSAILYSAQNLRASFTRDLFA
jgi:hypothetical protein